MPTQTELHDSYMKNNMVHVVTMYNDLIGYIQRYDEKTVDLFIEDEKLNITIPVEMIEIFENVN